MSLVGWKVSCHLFCTLECQNKRAQQLLREKAEILTFSLFSTKRPKRAFQDVDDVAGRDEDEGLDDAEGHRALQPREHSGTSVSGRVCF